MYLGKLGVHQCCRDCYWDGQGCSPCPWPISNGGPIGNHTTFPVSWGMDRAALLILAPVAHPPSPKCLMPPTSVWPCLNVDWGLLMWMRTPPCPRPAMHSFYICIYFHSLSKFLVQWKFSKDLKFYTLWRDVFIARGLGRRPRGNRWMRDLQVKHTNTSYMMSSTPVTSRAAFIFLISC